MTHETPHENEDSSAVFHGNVPANWHLSRLKYIAHLVTEKATESINPIGLENISSWTGKVVNTGTEFESVGTKFAKGDVLFGKLRPYLAKVMLAKRPGEAVGDFHVLRPISTNSGYLQLTMLTQEFISIVDGSTYGAKMPRASWDFMSNLKLPVPPVEEQSQIANFLDHETAKIDTLIDKQQQLIKLLKEKRQAVISHAVTKGINPDVKMKDSGVEWLGEVPEHWKVGSMRWYINIGSGEALSNLEFESEPDPINQFRVFGGNGTLGYSSLTNTISKVMAVGRVGALCGNVHLINTECWITDNALRISSWSNFQDDYLYFMLLAAQLNQYASKSAQPLITGEQVKALRGVFPPLDEQLKIADHIQLNQQKMTNLIEKSRGAIRLMKERRIALISAAVTGKIDVRNAA